MNFDCQAPIATGASATGLAGVSDPIQISNVLALSTPVGTVLEVPENANANGWRFSKVGAVLKSGLSFTINVPIAYRENVKIGWSNTGADPANTLVVHACKSTTDKAAWLVYPGGFYVKTPVCLPLEVITQGKTDQLKIPLGVSCP